MGGSNWGGFVRVDGHPAPGPNDDNLAFWDRVTASYFDVIGNPIVKGRGIFEQDIASSRHVAVINETFARKFFANVDPIGKYFGQHDIGSEREYEIVGIAKDARYLTFKLDQPISPFFFLPEAQHDLLKTNWGPSGGSHFMHDIVIVTTPGASLPIAQVRQAMASIDPNLPIIAIRTLKEQVTLQFAQQRLIARLTSFFGILSLVLASIGLYGVTAYNAGRRTNEIGIRMARKRCRAGAPRRIRPDRHWTAARRALVRSGRTLPRPPIVRPESVQSRRNCGSSRGLRILRTGRVVDSSPPSQFHFAAGSIARRVSLTLHPIGVD
jgi:hypothetical protein